MHRSAWRGSTAFRGRSWRQLLPVAIVVVAFVVVAAWNIGDAGFSDFYGSAARSMSENWRAFFFGSFDPAATITLDKLSGFLVPEAASASIFGFHAWSLALPEVIEGAVTLIAVYVIASRWRSWRVGMIALVVTATTPLLVSMFDHPMEDALVTMSLAVALMCWQSAFLSGRMLPLVFSALWVAVGFQAKMIQAWLILPALVVGILLVEWAPLARRVKRAAVFTAVAVAGSVLWMSIVQSIPASDRPYFDGSTNNNIFTTVFSYNGINRLFHNALPGTAPHPAESAQAAIAIFRPDASTVKLLVPVYATQVGWLYPLAIAALVLIALRIARNPDWRRDANSVFGLVVGIWLLSATVFVSLIQIPHTAYIAAISVPLSLVVGCGTVELLRLWRSGDIRLRRSIVVIGAVQVAWVVTILGASLIAPVWLVIFVIGAAAASVGLIIVRPPDRLRRASHRTLAVVACAAVLAAPLAWTLSTLDPQLDGTAVDAYAGPHLAGSSGYPTQPSTTGATTSFAHFALRPPVLDAANPKLGGSARKYQRYVVPRVVRGAFLLATTSWPVSAPFILDRGYSVLTIGGYSGADPSPTLVQVQSLVRSGQLRFVLTGGDPASTQPSATRTSIVTWVTTTCRLALESGGTPHQSGTQLWDCDREPRATDDR